MIYVAIVCAGLGALVAWERRQSGRREVEREQAWSRERSELITRIQHPEFVVATPERPAQPDAEILIPETDEIDLVGTIRSISDDD